MAQLIKLQDYISRYETDFYRYPGQFIRLKKENWKKLLNRWEQEYTEPSMEYFDEKEPQKSTKRFSFRGLFNGKKQQDVFEHLPANNSDAYFIPKDEETLKYYFLDDIFKFQVKWASSTIREYSAVDDKYRMDAYLKYFLQRFPDTFLVMYQPIFQLHKAAVEGEIILITPVEVICIAILEENENVIFIPEDGRTWYREFEEIQTRILSPTIGLKRTENIVKSIFNKYNIDIPITKVVLSKNNKIEFKSEPFNTQYIGKEQYIEWFDHLRAFSSPLKHKQLKAGEALLKHCRSTFTQRPEWLHEDDQSIFDL
ncbi:hypothetical protein SAMN05421676_11831 [Salinibacillus kushneri]|uniref:Nuclease-related domain-containing protein n=1 Tax=Salinibacillus kushneri TaxID=237682 RepID=A0A1I0JD14_9BACI|nr:hypothetical protein [Salinibacillus kushneri]SEU07967.1 hypothetical protein SAMN05421676_11831 [Salinibacillus kushneri]